MKDKKIAINCTHLNAANKVLEIIAPTTRIVRKKYGWCVEWTGYYGVAFSMRWQLKKGSSDYPVWYHHWGHGGTCVQALSQLVRWLQCKPVLPLHVWRWWTGPGIAMGMDRGPEIVSILREAGYPEQVNCVLCDQPISGGLDWWNVEKVSGPCCDYMEGCRQSGKSEVAR